MEQIGWSLGICAATALAAKLGVAGRFLARKTFQTLAIQRAGVGSISGYRRGGSRAAGKLAHCGGGGGWPLVRPVPWHAAGARPSGGPTRPADRDCSCPRCVAACASWRWWPMVSPCCGCESGIPRGHLPTRARKPRRLIRPTGRRRFIWTNPLSGEICKAYGRRWCYQAGIFVLFLFAAAYVYRARGNRQRLVMGMISPAGFGCRRGPGGDIACQRRR